MTPTCPRTPDQFDQALPPADHQHGKFFCRSHIEHHSRGGSAVLHVERLDQMAALELVTATLIQGFRRSFAAPVEAAEQAPLVHVGRGVKPHRGTAAHGSGVDVVEERFERLVEGGAGGGELDATVRTVQELVEDDSLPW